MRKAHPKRQHRNPFRAPSGLAAVREGPRSTGTSSTLPDYGVSHSRQPNSAETPPSADLHATLQIVVLARRLAAGVVGLFVGVQVALSLNFGRPLDADDVVPMVLGVIAGLLTYAAVLLIFAEKPFSGVLSAVHRFINHEKPGK